MYYRISPKPPETVIKTRGDFAYWQSPFWHEDFLDALHAEVPESDRRWHKAKKVWAVRAQYTEALAELVERIYRRRPEIEEA